MLSRQRHSLISLGDAINFCPWGLFQTEESLLSLSTSSSALYIILKNSSSDVASSVVTLTAKPWSVKQHRFNTRQVLKRLASVLWMKTSLTLLCLFCLRFRRGAGTPRWYRLYGCDRWNRTYGKDGSPWKHWCNWIHWSYWLYRYKLKACSLLTIHHLPNDLTIVIRKGRSNITVENPVSFFLFQDCTLEVLSS